MWRSWRIRGMTSLRFQMTGVEEVCRAVRDGGMQVVMNDYVFV